MIEGRRGFGKIKWEDCKTPHLVLTDSSQCHHLATHPRIHITFKGKLSAE